MSALDNLHPQERQISRVKPSRPGERNRVEPYFAVAPPLSTRMWGGSPRSWL
jgi:hypothetical protein